MENPHSGSESGIPEKSLQSHGIAWILLVIALTFTALVTYNTRKAVEEEAIKDFTFECNEIIAKIYAGLNSHAQLLRTGAAFFESSDSVSRSEWNIFISHQKIETNLPGVQGVGYAMIIPGNALREHEQNIRSEGLAGYTIKPAGNRETYTPVVYLEPFSGKNLQAIGYDMYSEPIRRAAMKHACDSNTAALSGKVKLVQDAYAGNLAGALLYVPIYRRGMEVATVADRRKALKGWVFSPYRMNDLVRGILGDFEHGQKKLLRLQIYDNDSILHYALLFDSYAEIADNSDKFQKMNLKLPVIFNGKHWTLLFTRTTQLSSFFLHRRVLHIFIAGTAISILIFLLAILLLNSRYREKLTARLARHLKANLDKHVALYNAIPDAVFVTDSKTGVIEEINSKASEQYGYTHDEFIAMSASDIHFYEEQQNHPAIMDESRIQGLYHKKKDGLKFPVEISSSTFEIGNRLKIITVARDITERKKVEDALHASEELYKSTINASPDDITVSDLNGKILMVSPATLPLLGYESADEIIGHQLTEFLVPNDRDRAISNIELLFKDKGPGPETYRCLRKDGSTFYGEINGEIIYDANGQPEGFVFIVRNIDERKHAEKELRESEEKWRSLVSNSPDFIALHDKDGRYLFLNHFAEGFSEKDILGHSLFEFLAPESKELFKSKFDECISTWKPVKFEHIAKGNNSEMRIYEESFVPVLTKNEEVNILAVAKDITEQKLSQRKLQESEEHFRLIFEDGSIAMALVDADFRFMQVNKAFVNLLGYTEAELLKLTFAGITDPEFIEQDFQQIKCLLNREIAIYHTERKYITRDNKTIWGLVQVSVMYNKAGEFISLLVMINNITKRKQAEESLLESQEIFNQFMLNSPIYVFFKDANIRSLRLSRNFEQMLGRPLNELLGKTMDEIFPSGLAKKMVADDLMILNEGKQIEIEEELNGRYYSTTKFPIFIDGKPMYLAGYTIDITSRKLTGDTIKAALKEKEVLLREVHHRVKNNLQVVSSLLNLQANKITDKAFKETLEQSRNRIRSIALVHEKLYQTGKFAEINIKEYTSSLVSELFRVYLADPHKINIRSAIEDITIPLVYAIPCGLILNEIISNSIKYAFPKDKEFIVKPEIFITLKTLPNKHLQICAGDNGIGLPDDYQFSDSLSLGLYLIRILSTEQLDGKIEIDTKKGTIFTITFNPYSK